jgi:flagellar FliJ protein
MFKFPLQRILELREKREELAAKQLSDAQSAADATRAQRDSLRAVHEEGQAQVAGAQSGPQSVGHMQSLSYVLSQLGQRLASADRDTQAAEAAVARVHTELTSASQNRQVLDRLRDRQLEAYRTAETTKDRTLMDAIALTQHSKKAGTAGSDGESGS